MRYHDDPEAYEQRLMAKLDPENIRATLAFAGLYQITHEMIKSEVIVQVHDFFLLGFNDDGFVYDEESYRRDVLARRRRTSSVGHCYGSQIVRQSRSPKLIDWTRSTPSVMRSATS